MDHDKDNLIVEENRDQHRSGFKRQLVFLPAPISWSIPRQSSSYFWKTTPPQGSFTADTMSHAINIPLNKDKSCPAEWQ